MATKIYSEGASIIFENVFGDGQKQSINSGHFDWQKVGGVYKLRDGIENQSYELGTFDNVQNKNGVAYASETALELVLNGLVNLTASSVSPESGGATVNNTDVTGNQALNSTFGDAITATRHPSIAAQFVYGLVTGYTNPREDAATITTVSTGSVSVVNGELVLQTGTAADGSAIIESNDYVEYLPGHELYAYFTSIFSTIVLDQVKRVGAYDSSNGFFVEDDGEKYYFVRRKLGTDYKQEVEESEIFTDGTFDFEKFNILLLRYGYLGVAPIKLSTVKPEGGFAKVSHINYAGKNTTIHTAQTYLPLRAEITNTGATTNGIIKIGSVSAGNINGNMNVRPSSRRKAANLKKSIATSPNIIAVFRNKTTFNSIENRIKTRLLRAAGSSDGVKPVDILIYRNPPITNSPTWFDVETGVSVMEYSVNATIAFTGDVPNDARLMIPFPMGKTDNFKEDVSELNLTLRSGEWAAIIAVSAGASDISFGMNWEERF